VANAGRNTKAIDEWVHNISKLQKAKTADTVQYRKSVKNKNSVTKYDKSYSRTMPDVDTLMQEWPSQFEDLLKEVNPIVLLTYLIIECSSLF
jgi:intraflagellar transport protein 46